MRKRTGDFGLVSAGEMPNDWTEIAYLNDLNEAQRLNGLNDLNAQ